MIQRRLFIGASVALGVSTCMAYFLRRRQSPPTVPFATDESDRQIWSPDSLKIDSWRFVEDFDKGLAVFETVFWDRSDTESLRRLIRTSDLVRGKVVLEIGTGSGLVALCCLKGGAARVVATDINQNAVANARYNADNLCLAKRIDVRHVCIENLSAFSVIEPREQFDVIVSNPPWVNQQPRSIDEFALYDESFALITSLFDGLPDHLRPDGRLYLAYGCVDAIRTVQRLAREHQFECVIRDERNLDDLPAEFLPGMLLEIRR